MGREQHPTIINISIHAPREGSDTLTDATACKVTISIHAPREGSDAMKNGRIILAEIISIHAPREGSDQDVLQAGWLLHGISIHAPREGSDGVEGTVGHNFLFDFYPRSPRGERPWYAASAAVQGNISIHAPREGSDLLMVMGRNPSSRFLSTLPARGATVDADLLKHGGRNFYPRSPRGERHLDRRNRCLCIHFYPRSPRGERPARVRRTARPALFLSTLPARGATEPCALVFVRFHISIHAPREGSDLDVMGHSCPLCIFLSTLPARGATR